MPAGGAPYGPRAGKPGFIFGGNTGISSAAELEALRRRDEMMSQQLQGMGTPQNLGQGIHYVGHALFSKLAENRRKEAEMKAGAQQEREARNFGTRLYNYHVAQGIDPAAARIMSDAAVQSSLSGDGEKGFYGQMLAQIAQAGMPQPEAELTDWQRKQQELNQLIETVKNDPDVSWDDPDVQARLRFLNAALGTPGTVVNVGGEEGRPTHPPGYAPPDFGYNYAWDPETNYFAVDEDGKHYLEETAGGPETRGWIIGINGDTLRKVPDEMIQARDPATGEFIYGTNGEPIVIPMRGTELWRKREKEAQENIRQLEAEMAKASTEAEAVANATTQILRLMDESWQPTTGLFGAILGAVPGTDAYNVRAYLQTLQARSAFKGLEVMREASPTGGAVGQVSNYEAGLFVAGYTPLNANMSGDEFRRSLEVINAVYTNDTLRAAYESGDQLAFITALDEHFDLGGRAIAAATGTTPEVAREQAGVRAEVANTAAGTEAFVEQSRQAREAAATSYNADLDILDGASP